MRCQESGQRETTCWEGLALQELLHKLDGEELVQHGVVCQSYKIPRMSYEDIRKIMDRKLAIQMKGVLTDKEIRTIVVRWMDQRDREDLDPKVVAREVKRLEKKLD